MSVTLTFPVTLVSSLGRLYPAFPAKNRSLYLVSEKQKIHNKNNNNTTTKNHPIDKKKLLSTWWEYRTMSLMSFSKFCFKVNIFKPINSLHSF